MKPKASAHSAMWGLLPAAGFIFAAHRIFVARALATNLLVYEAYSPHFVNAGEGALFVLLSVLGIPAIAWLAGVLKNFDIPGYLDQLAPLEQRIAVAGGLGVACSCILIRTFVFHHADFTDDERVIGFQAQIFQGGSFTATGPLSSPAPFAHDFILELTGGRRIAVFPPGQAGLLALSAKLGAPHLTQAISGFAIVVLAAALARQIDRRVSIVTTVLLAASPMLVFMAATRHSVVPTSALCLGAIVAANRRMVGSSLAIGANALLCGLLCGLAFLVRPLDGVLAAVTSTGLLLIRQVGWFNRFRGLALAVIGGLPGLAAQLFVYRVSSGSYFKSPYTVWLEQAHPNAKLFGFGTTVWGIQHTFEIALEKTMATFGRLDLWSFGTALSLMFFGAAFLLRRRKVVHWLVLAFPILHATAYFFYMFGSVHDFGSFYHLPSLAFVAVASAWAMCNPLDSINYTVGQTAGAVTDAEHDAGHEPNGNPWLLRAGMAGVVVAILTFWPMMFRRLEHVGKTTQGPILAAQEKSRTAGKILVFYRLLRATGHLRDGSWVFHAPPPSPTLDEDVIWVRDLGSAWNLLVTERFPNRTAMTLTFDDASRPIIEPLAIP